MIIWVTGVLRRTIVDTDISTTCAQAIFRVSSVDSKMASTQVFKTSVANNSPSQDSSHPDNHFQSMYVTPGFKPFSYRIITLLFY